MFAKKYSYILLLLFTFSLVGCDLMTSTTEPLKTTEVGTNTQNVSATPLSDFANESQDTSSTENSDSNDNSDTTNTTDITDTTGSTDTASDDLASIVLTSYQVIETDTVLYHKEIFYPDMEQLALEGDLLISDQRLTSLIEHLHTYNYNTSINQIASISLPDSPYALCNKLNKLPLDYVPSDLAKPTVRFVNEEENERKYLRQEAADGLSDLFDSAIASGYDLIAVSGYRSYALQEVIYQNKVDSRGLEEADKVSARPGHSEHQSGLAMDISCDSILGSLEYRFGETPEGIWVAENAHKFGFIIRYPENMSPITGYNYEPWHLRYIGIDIASFLYEYQFTLEELYILIQKTGL